MVRAIYPGSFDPVHNGHLDIAKRAGRLFDHVIVGVYELSSKGMLFDAEQRVALVAESVAGVPNVDVVSFGSLVTELANQVNAEYIVRGLRAGVDFETEFEMALMWNHIDPDIDVVCMMSALEYQFVYSSRIKEVAMLGGDVGQLVPEAVAVALKEKFQST